VLRSNKSTSKERSDPYPSELAFPRDPNAAYPGPNFLDSATPTPKSPINPNKGHNPRHLRVSTYHMAIRYLLPGYTVLTMWLHGTYCIATDHLPTW